MHVSSRASLEGLLCRLFDDSYELRGFLRGMSHSETLLPRLPGVHASLFDVATATAEMLERWGSLNDCELWLRLEHEHRSHQTLIRQVRADLVDQRAGLTIFSEQAQTELWLRRAQNLRDHGSMEGEHVYVVCKPDEIDHLSGLSSFKIRPNIGQSSVADADAEARNLIAEARVVLVIVHSSEGLRGSARNEVEYALLLGRPLISVCLQEAVLSPYEDYLLAFAHEHTGPLSILHETIKHALDHPNRPSLVQSFPNSRIERMLGSLLELWPTPASIAVLCTQIGLRTPIPASLAGPVLWHWLLLEIASNETAIRRFVAVLRSIPAARSMATDLRDLLCNSHLLGEHWLTLSPEGRDVRVSASSKSRPIQNAFIEQGKHGEITVEPGLSIALECNIGSVSVRIVASVPSPAGSLFRIWRGLRSTSYRLWPRDGDMLGDDTLVLLDEEIELEPFDDIHDHI